MEDTQELLYTLASLSRRTQGRASRTLGTLAQQLRREQRRLSAAHFLITGNRYSPHPAGREPVRPPGPVPAHPVPGLPPPGRPGPLRRR